MAELKIHKCKLCGEPLDITKAVGGAVQCGYCGTMYTLPKETADDRLLNFLDSGELSLDKGDFEGAMTSYSKAAEIDGNEPEAHFGKALSKFKVRYIKDEVANRLQPICYEVTDKKFSDDVDYLRAFAKATPEQRAVYEEKAKDIDYIQSEFYNLKQSGLDYDCFICVKVTDDKTKLRTADYKYADDIYFALKKKYKPFFSERELTNVTGADYEARILYALYSSECMLVVCGDEEYLQTKWVKNEYSRFLKLVNDSEKETDSIAIAFTGKPIERLPGRNGKLQGIDLGKLGALSRVEEFVESHTPAARAKRAAEAEEKKRAEEEQKAKLKELEEQLEKMKSATSGDISYDELAKRIEEQRIARENEEAERERQEWERIARENEEAKEAERKRQEEIRLRPWVYLQNYPTLKNYNKADFEISGTELKKYTGKGSDVNIPIGVTSICRGAFCSCDNPKSVVIPDGVTSIGEKAFLNCNKLKSITIPESVTSIGERAFGLCDSLESIEVDANNKNYSSLDGILYNKDKTEIIKIPETKTEVMMPESVTSIGAAAFQFCKNLKSIEVDAKNKNYSSQDGILYNKGKTELIKVPAAKTEVIIPAGVTSIGNSAFKNCGKLTSVVIPNGVTSIGDNAFEDCKQLKTINIPDGVTSIGKYAFRGCIDLTSVVIPNGVTSMGDHAFEDCKNRFARRTDLKIYCRADKKPESWAADWNLIEDGNVFTKKKAKVIWNYKG